MLAPDRELSRPLHNPGSNEPLASELRENEITLN